MYCLFLLWMFTGKLLPQIQACLILKRKTEGQGATTTYIDSSIASTTHLSHYFWANGNSWFVATWTWTDCGQVGLMQHCLANKMHDLECNANYDHSMQSYNLTWRLGAI